MAEKLADEVSGKTNSKADHNNSITSENTDLDDILTKNNPILEEILQEEGMANERSSLTKTRKLEKSFEDLLTGLSDENDSDIDDLVDFDNLPEHCSDTTLTAIAKTNKPFTNKSSLDDSLKMADFIDEKNEGKLKPSKTEEAGSSRNFDLLGDIDDFVSKHSEDQEKVESEQLIDWDVSVATQSVKREIDDPFEFESQGHITPDAVKNNRDDLFEFESQDHENVEENETLIEFEDSERIDNNDNDYVEETIDNENSAEIQSVEEDDDDKYEGNFEVDDDVKEGERIEVIVTYDSDEDIDQNAEEICIDIKKEDSLDLDAVVQDNSQLDVDIGKQKTVLRKKGSLAKRRKPSRTSILSMGGADEDSHFTDSTEPKPQLQNGHGDEEDVFSRQSSSNDSDVSSPPAKKPLPGMVALPGMGMPMAVPRKKSGESTPSDSDVTPDEPKKDFRAIGVKLPVPSSRGSSESENQSEITNPVLRKLSDREPAQAPVENTHQFEKPKLKAVSRPRKERKSSDDATSAKFEVPALKQVERTPRKSRSSSDKSEDSDSKHVFQTPKLRTVDNAPTESLQFFQGKTGQSDDGKSRISDDSKHLFQTPKLKKVDNPPTQTLKLLHGRSEEAVDSETTLSLGHHNDESSTDDLEYGIYFEKPQLRNVPKPTETLRLLSKERSQFEVPELRNVPKMEIELKSPPASDSDKKFDVPQLKSVQKQKSFDNQEKEEGTFQIPTLRSTPVPKRREPPKSPEAKTFDVPILRRTPRVKPESDNVEIEKPPSGLFEKPKLKSARSLQQEMDDSSNKGKHRFELPNLRNTPSKGDSVKRSDSSKSDSEKPSWLQETKLRPSHVSSLESSGDSSNDKPSWLSESKEKTDAKENKNTNSQDVFDNLPRKSSIPLQETTSNHDNALNGHPIPSRTRLTSAGSDKDGDDHHIKKNPGRDQYVPSWLKTTDTRLKSPSTPNLAFVTPSKDTSEVPQWRLELAEKRKGRKDSDVDIHVEKQPSKTNAAGSKGLPPWKVELEQKKMRQTPAKAHDTKKSSEPEWKKAADEKRQRLRNSGLLQSVKPTK